MSKLGSVGLSEIVLEPFPDSDKFDYFLTKKSRTKETPSPRDTNYHT